MKKAICIVLCIIGFHLISFAQSNSDTNNNSITIQGTVYYFKPSSTKSSPLPKIVSTGLISPGSWYGENAAKAWAAISDWVIEHCIAANEPVIPQDGEIVYITSVHVYRGNTKASNKYAVGSTRWMGEASRDGVTIYYWIVTKGDKMENGRSAYRSFAF